ncbi:hypothetical protein GCM10017771_86890 [Streptomyces capitiformicae]|uniref:Uncharacterized protein n=1 Tax=Streptomyces capitiformicae TaxID=2014920 RepID=A0A918ZQP4_9ACTN|nr:hypothetical protein GCM10017771_86890 [Streptomyces capitiformicae]
MGVLWIDPGQGRNPGGGGGRRDCQRTSEGGESGTVGEVEALKLLTQRVEDHRNEQRCRQQQLDQPADQAGPRDW